MGVEIDTEGTGANWYQQGLYENMAIVDATTVEGVYFEGVVGGAVTVVAPLELTVLLGWNITWDVVVKHVELHGTKHYHAAYSDGWTERNTNFSAESIGSHTQAVEGTTQWTNDGDFKIQITQAKKGFSVTTLKNGTVSLTAGSGSLSLADKSVTLQCNSDITVRGQNNATVVCGANSLTLNSNQASMKRGSAGIVATAASTQISGTKVEIGVPGSPGSPQVATQVDLAQMTVQVNAQNLSLQTSIDQLRAELDTLKSKCVPRQAILAALSR